MSKQYLALHSIDDVHPTDIFALATTPTSIISASGFSNIHIHSTTSDTFPLVQTLTSAHRTGVHHLTVSSTGTRLVSVDFSGDAKIWNYNTTDGQWTLQGPVEDTKASKGDLWAVTLSLDGQYLAGTRSDGRIHVWDVAADPVWRVREYEGRGSFGLCVDLSADGKFVASGHDSGNIYVFSTESTRLLHALPGLIKPVRSVKFSPGSSLLAAAGDAMVISLFDPRSGEQVASVPGHGGWITSLDWNHSGQYLLSGALDGKVKVWDVELRKCVATHNESEKGLWSVKWLPKGETSVDRVKAERFVTAGASRAIAVYREATGG